MRKDLLKIKDPKLQDIEEKVTELEVMRRANKDAKAANTQPQQTSQAKHKKKSAAAAVQGQRNSSQNNNNVKFTFPEHLKGKCKRCARDHAGKDCKFKDAECHKCGKKGHIAPACMGKKKTSSTSKANSAASSRAASPVLSLIHI